MCRAWKKCVPKTAVKWLEAYGSLTGVMEHAAEIKGKVGENLQAALPQLPLSYLVTIKTDVDFIRALDGPRKPAPHFAEMVAAGRFQTLGLPHLA